MDPRKERWRARAGSVIVLAAVCAFCVLYVVAARAYPGGTWVDPTTRGHRFWQNFLCDLEWHTALDGAPNPGASAMRAAMVAIDVGLLALWLCVPVLFVRRRARSYQVRALGVLSSVGLLVVALVPSERSQGLHALAVVAAALPGILAALWVAQALFSDEPRPRLGAALGLATLGVAAVDLVLYVRHTLVPGTSTFAIPAVQKIALMLALAWMATLAVRVWRGAAG